MADHSRQDKVLSCNKWGMDKTKQAVYSIIIGYE